MMMKTTMFRVLAVLALILPLAMVAGCGVGAAEQIGDTQGLNNRVDSSLPKAQQAKQTAVQRLLNAVVDGVGDESGLAIYAPGIDLRAQCEDIRKGPKGQLIGWEFKGQPTGNRVPVVLYFAEQQYSQWSHLPDKANPWAKPYWFRTEFRVPDRFSGQAAWLHLDGLNYRADVWLNGRQIGEAKSVAGMFRRFRFEVSSLLSPNATNALAVLVYPLDYPGDPAHEQLDGLTGSFGPNGGDGEILRNVTEYCAIGWDWMPAARDRNLGLWQHVWLQASGPVAVRDPATFTELKSPAGEEAGQLRYLRIQASLVQTRAQHLPPQKRLSRDRYCP
jgi:hypothetical protein